MRIICLGGNASYRLFSLFPFDIFDSYLVTLEKNVLSEVIVTSQNSSRMSFRLLWSDKNDGRWILHLSCTMHECQIRLGLPEETCLRKKLIETKNQISMTLENCLHSLDNTFRVNSVNEGGQVLLRKLDKCERRELLLFEHYLCALNSFMISRNSS